MVSSPASGSSVSSLPDLPLRFSPAYSVEQYIARQSACRNVQRFIALPNHLRLLSISHNHHARYTTAGA